MIFATSGEIDFSGGLRIVAHSTVETVLREFRGAATSRFLPAVGWTQHLLGEHSSDIGTFEVEMVSGPAGRVEGVFLSHVHPFYDPSTLDDSDRRAFHEGIIAADLLGQREFSWGHVFCRRDEESNRDWLVVIYSPFGAVALHRREVGRMLFARRDPPREP